MEHTHETDGCITMANIAERNLTGPMNVLELTKRVNNDNRKIAALVADKAALVKALRGLFDCEALEMYRRDDNPEWDAPEVAAARAALAAAGETT